MSTHTIYMERALQLARKGEGVTEPNPMVGCVIVHRDRIIGEGYHRQFGGPHAEVHAITSVKDPSLLKDSTLYVSLEPCSHHGKTPPCSELIISHQIPRVVIAVQDPNPIVSGRGIAMMRSQGVEVTLGVLEREARLLNSRFFVNQIQKRPYVILKWAESQDSFMDHNRTSLSEKKPVVLSNPITQCIVHKFRAHTTGIMVGTNTAILDNPQLTTRKWYGKNPTRIVIDRENKIPTNAALFNRAAKTLIFSAKPRKLFPDSSSVKQIIIDFSKDTIQQILNHLYHENISSVLVEGGAYLLRSFIKSERWDEAYIERSPILLKEGVKAPKIEGSIVAIKEYAGSLQYHLKSKTTRNFL